MSVRARLLGATERQVVCEGCGERGTVFYYADGTSFHLTGLFYFCNQKRLHGNAVIACGRCQQIFLGENGTRVLKSGLALNEQN